MTAKRHGSRKITAGSRKSVNTASRSQRKWGNPKSLPPRITAKKLTGDGSFNAGFPKNKNATITRLRKPGVHRKAKSTGKRIVARKTPGLLRFSTGRR